MSLACSACATRRRERQALIGNHFYPQQKFVSKVREGATVTKKYDRACTPYARALAHPDIKALPRRLTSTRRSFNPAAVQRQIQTLYDELLTLATAKNQPTGKPQVTPPTHADLSG
jgi:Flp pilus assembly protein TadD